jgi:hypothetical protein
MIRRRPIPRTRFYPDSSLRYDVIMDGAVRVYRSDGREVCQDNAAGWREYKRRVKVMWLRQGGRCCDCGRTVGLGECHFRTSEAQRNGSGLEGRQNRKRWATVERGGALGVQWS